MSGPENPGYTKFIREQGRILRSIVGKRVPNWERSVPFWDRLTKWTNRDVSSVQAPSRASPLPHLECAPCGSGLAREER
ncbi:hypothetical protein C2E19_24360 [Pseudomonas sp. DTU12.3]|nr:hypothetical protein C2E19_24360 [Pseudomonas sp. DTU12.3]